jgi:hypothetical protein
MESMHYLLYVQPRTPFIAIALLGLWCAACGSEPKTTGKYPPRQPGCAIQIFPEEPSYQTENIGPVRTSCDESISDADCLRELKDQACKLGADTVWGVSDTPTKQAGKKRLSGRAAHQK